MEGTTGIKGYLPPLGFLPYVFLLMYFVATTHHNGSYTNSSVLFALVFVGFAGTVVSVVYIRIRPEYFEGLITRSLRVFILYFLLLAFVVGVRAVEESSGYLPGIQSTLIEIIGTTLSVVSVVSITLACPYSLFLMALYLSGKSAENWTEKVLLGIVQGVLILLTVVIIGISMIFYLLLLG